MNGRELPVSCPIESIYFVDQVERTEAVRFRSASTPHHLLHITLSGEVSQWTEGRPCLFREGDVVWYHEGEAVEGEILKAPWRFYTIGFSAPRLSPPPESYRVRPADTATIELARKLHQCWKQDDISDLEHSIKTTALLLELILGVAPMELLPPALNTYPTNAREQWWTVEKRLRHRLDERVDLDDIARMAGMSLRTLNRACKAATGMSPIQRYREIRLSGARGLLQFTDLTITEIALRCGYSRVQDFSRDIHKRYGEPPRSIRRSGPDYQELQEP